MAIFEMVTIAGSLEIVSVQFQLTELGPSIRRTLKLRFLQFGPAFQKSSWRSWKSGLRDTALWHKMHVVHDMPMQVHKTT